MASSSNPSSFATLGESNLSKGGPRTKQLVVKTVMSTLKPRRYLQTGKKC